MLLDFNQLKYRSHNITKISFAEIKSNELDDFQDSEHHDYQEVLKTSRDSLEYVYHRCEGSD